MPIQKQFVLFTKEVFFFQNGNSSNIPPKENIGYCKLDIQVTHKTYENGNTFYHISYLWGFSPWGEWGEANILLNQGKLLSWTELNHLIHKNKNKNSTIFQKALQLKQMFPFNDFPQFIENNMDGDIIKQNKMTDEIVKTLTLNNKELKLISGNTTPTRYRINIMNMISYLWD